MTFGRIVTVNQTVISCKQANLFEYINSYIKISQSPAPSCTIVFFTQNNWSNFLMIFISWSRERGKLILRNYFPLGSEYARVFNIPGFWICFWFWICQGSGYTVALNIGFWIRLVMPECTKICLNGYCFTFTYYYNRFLI